MNERSKEPVQETPKPPEEAATERLGRQVPKPEAATLTQKERDLSMFEQ